MNFHLRNQIFGSKNIITYRFAIFDMDPKVPEQVAEQATLESSSPSSDADKVKKIQFKISMCIIGPFMNIFFFVTFFSDSTKTFGKARKASTE